ncbi:MAG: sensor histidine kinase [Ignavibacteria bacterium]|nr:sensor histidine kinase [Ignavibacteria bacterium]
MRVKHFTVLAYFLLLMIAASSVFAQNNLDSLIKLQGQLKDKKEKIDNSIKIAMECVYSFDFSNATNYLFSAAADARDIDYKPGLANALRLLGNVYSMSGIYPKALEAYFESLRLVEELKDSNSIARIYNNIGLIYIEQVNYEKSLDYFNRAIEVERKIKDSILIVSTMNNLGIVLSNIDSLEQAEKVFKEALLFAEKNEDIVNITGITLNLGDLYTKMNKFDDAVSCINAALAAFNEMGDLNMVASCYNQLGVAHKKVKKTKEAVEFFNTALEIADSIQSVEIIFKTYYHLYESHSELKQWEKALNYYIKYASAKDSYFSMENSNKLVELEKNYEFQKKEDKILAEKKANDEKYRTIIFFSIIITVIIIAFSIVLSIYYKQKVKANRQLNELNAELSIKNKELQEVNFTKDKFFSIIAHDLKNPIGNFKSVTTLISESYDDFTEEDRIEFINLLKDSAQNLYSLLENLLQWSRSQRGLIKAEKVVFNLKELTAKLFGLLSHSANAKQISLESNVNEDVKVFADMNLLNTVLRNLISNSIKFTKENGSITLSTSDDDENTIISVSDTGVGMEKEKLDKLFRIDVNVSSPGTSNEAGTGLGLVLCKEFIEIQDGSIRVESEEGKGTTFYINLPKN